jgi:hypothetical protein
MTGYEIFWTFIILFSLISFTYMSIKMLAHGIPEIREMFKHLGNRKKNSS